MNKNHLFSDLYLSFFLFNVFQAFFLNSFLRVVYWVVFRDAFWATFFRAILIEEDDEEDDEKNEKKFTFLTILITFFRAILIEEDAKKFIFLTNLRSTCLDVIFEMSFCDAMKVLRCDENFAMRANFYFYHNISILKTFI